MKFIHSTQKSIHRPFLAALIASLCLSACATTGNIQNPVQSENPIASCDNTTTENESIDSTTLDKKKLQTTDILPILKHISPSVLTPNAVPTEPTMKIQSGKDDDGVWVEGTGFFYGTLSQVYDDLTNPLVIGPVHLTKKITADSWNRSENKTSYVMHVKMRYIMSIEFDLTALLRPFYDGETLRGWTYISEKTAGTRFLTKITTRVLVEAVSDNAFRVDFHSENEATMDKESEARAHLEALFQYWMNASQSRIIPLNHESNQNITEQNTQNIE